MSFVSISVGGPGVAAVSFGGPSLVLICGPCVIESREQLLRHAARVAEIARTVGLPFVFKSSYDKANRTSSSSFRGVGLEEGVALLEEVRHEFGVPVVTDVHSAAEAEEVGKRVDLLQIPAFLCRQTDLLAAAGRFGAAVMVKKGQFLHPADMAFAREKVQSGGGAGVIFCERGTCFGYRELVVDLRSLDIMRNLGAPVVFDATHSVQIMGGRGSVSGGERGFVPGLARAAVAFGADGIFLEAHENPDEAPSDGANMIPLSALAPLLRDLKAVHTLHLETREGPL